MFLFSLLSIFGLGIGIYFAYIISKNGPGNNYASNLNNGSIKNLILNTNNNNIPIDEYNHKNIPSNRNGYSFNCNYTYQFNSNLVLQNDNNFDTSIVCVLMKSKPTNNFPIIVFENLINELSPLPIDAYELINGSIKIKSTYLNLNSNIKREENARKVALQISRQLWNTLSFGPEIVFLDKIIYKKNNEYEWLYSYEKSKYKTSNNNYITHGRLYDDLDKQTNLKAIELYVEPYARKIRQQDGKLEFETTINNDYNKKTKEFSHVTFDVYETFYSLAREYGKFLYNMKQMTSEKLFSILKPFFSDYEMKRKFALFYKYFNSLNSTEVINYNRRKNNKDIAISINDQNILDSFRTFFSANIQKLSSQFSDYSEDLDWQLATFKKIKYGLLHYDVNLNGDVENLDERRNYPLPQVLYDMCLDALKGDDETNGKIINQKAYEKLYLHLINVGYLVYVFNYEDSFIINGTSNNVSASKKYYLLSFNYVSTRLSQSLQIGKYFPLQSLINGTSFVDNEELKVSATGCLASPLSQRDLSNNHFESKVLKRVVKSNITKDGLAFQNLNYTNLSSKIDKEMLSVLAEYFSSENLYASLYAILAYQYPDKRHIINGCKYRYNQQLDATKKTSKYFISNDRKEGFNQFADYLQLKMFGISLFGDNNEREIFNKLLNYAIKNKKLPFYKARLYTFKQKEFLNDNYQTRIFSYSNNVITENEKQIKNWSTIYIPIFLKVNNIKDSFSLRMSYDGKKQNHKQAIDYDYNNFAIYISDLKTATIDNTQHIYKSLAYDDFKYRQHYVGIVLVFGYIYGQIEPTYVVNGITTSVAETTKIITSVNRFYLDKNLNQVYDANNQEILIGIQAIK